MDKIYHGCFNKNADGTNKIIVAGERCLAPTDKCFGKDPNDVKHGVKTRSDAIRSQPLVFKQLINTERIKLKRELMFM